MGTSPQKSEGRTSPPSNEDDVQKVAEIKEYLESKISDLEAELGKLKDMLVLVDTRLREKSFVPAIALRGSVTTASNKTQKVPHANQTKSVQTEVPKVNDPGKEIVENPNERQLRRTRDSMLLANALIDQSKVVIVPSKDVKLSQHTPPFESFFVNRILRGYQSKDQEESKNGKLKPDQVLEYNVQETQGTISSITVSNYRDNARLNEILSTITWAFTRMLEKT